MDISSKTLDDYRHAPSVQNDKSQGTFMREAINNFTYELIVSIKNKNMNVISCP